MSTFSSCFALLCNLCTTMALQHDLKKGFVALSYNILAESLGSNCIPWVMTAAPEFIQETEAATGQDWSSWNKSQLTPMYRSHFHKNLAVQDYIAMRGMWSAKRCEDENDLPPVLRTSLRVISSDTILYKDSGGSDQVAETLRGVLRRLLGPSDLGLRLFRHIVELEEEVFGWPVRGPRIFQEVLKNRELPAHLVAKGEPCETLRITASPDVFALMENDAQYSQACYRSSDLQESLEAAFFSQGYTSLLFHDPFVDKPVPSGIGIFWRAAVFELATEGDPSGPVQPLGSSRGERTYLKCGETYGGGAARNIDFFEQWHPRKGNGKEAETTCCTMPVEDRRHLAVVRLRHKVTGNIVFVAACHLMTTSRDSASSNDFPGEVRSFELAAAGRALQEIVPPDQALVMLGDFNTDAREFVSIHGSPLRSVNGRSLQADTGLEVSSKDGGEQQLQLRWPRVGREGPDLLLAEAFEPIHRWGKAVGSRADGGHCTSLNGERVEWIDYIWYSKSQLMPLAVSDTLSPARPIPDKEQGSDHVPVAVSFAFVGSPCAEDSPPPTTCFEVFCPRR